MIPEKVLTIEEASVLTSRLRKGSMSVSLVSGVFDIMHVGHLALFEEARKYGEALAVAVSTDEQVRANKDPQRPITPLADRLRLLSHLVDVDFVFPQRTWYTEQLLREVLPTVYVFVPWRNKEHMGEFIKQVEGLGVQLRQVGLDTSKVSSTKLIALIERLC